MLCLEGGAGAGDNEQRLLGACIKPQTSSSKALLVQPHNNPLCWMEPVGAVNERTQQVVEIARLMACDGGKLCTVAITEVTDVR